MWSHCGRINLLMAKKSPPTDSQLSEKGTLSSMSNSAPSSADVSKPVDTANETQSGNTNDLTTSKLQSDSYTEYESDSNSSTSGSGRIDSEADQANTKYGETSLAQTDSANDSTISETGYNSESKNLMQEVHESFDTSTAKSKSASDSPEEFQKKLGAVLRNGTLTREESANSNFKSESGLSAPSEKGLESSTIGTSGVEIEYRADERKDNLSKITRNDNGRVEESTREYKDRPDNLLKERQVKGKDTFAYERTFEEGKGPEALTKESLVQNSNSIGVKKEYQSGSRMDGLKAETWQKSDSAEISSKEFDNRQDGLKELKEIERPNLKKRIKNYEPEKSKDGLKSQIELNATDRQVYVRSDIFDSTINPDKKLSEHSKIEDGAEYSIKQYSGREDFLTKEHSQTSNQKEKVVKEFSNEKLLVPKKPYEFSTASDNGTRIEMENFDGGDQYETKVFNESSGLISTSGRDQRGKYVVSEISPEIKQKSYTDGTVITDFNQPKIEFEGASQIIQEPGRAPRFINAEGKSVFQPGDQKPVPVFSQFNFNGTVSQTYSDGTSKMSDLGKFVDSTSPKSLSKNTNLLENLAKNKDTDVKEPAIDGLFKAMDEGVSPGSKNPAEDSLLRLGRDPEHNASVSKLSLNYLKSPSSRTRQVASSVLLSSAQNWGKGEIQAMINSPSTELAASLSRVPTVQMDRYKSTFLDGASEFIDPGKNDNSTSGDQKLAIVGVIAATNGSNGLSKLGYQVSEQGDLISASGASGTRFTFTPGDSNRLRLKSAQSSKPGGLDGEQQRQDFDSTTGELLAINKQDKFGSYSESQFQDTEHGAVAQRRYDESGMVRTLFDLDDAGNRKELSEVRHLDGKPPQLVDAKGETTSLDSNQPIPLATSLEDGQAAKTIMSNGEISSQPIEEFVDGASAAQLSHHINSFSKAARSESPAKSSAIKAFSKMATSSSTDSSSKESAISELKILADNGENKQVTDSLLGVLNEGAPLTGESTTSTRAVNFIARVAGFEGLENAGLEVDTSGEGTMKDGMKYQFEKTDSGVIRAQSAQSADGKRGIEFNYSDDGMMQGSVETIRQSESTSSEAENIKLPPLRKGWGPYQALEQLRDQGKINMSNSEMVEAAVRIRDREFAKSGKTYFHRGEQFDMYSPEEIKAKGKEAGKDMIIHRDSSNNITKMERPNGTSLEISYKNNQPIRIHDGIGPDLVRSYDGKSWQFENKESSAGIESAPSRPNTGSTDKTDKDLAFKGDLNIDTETGIVSIDNESGSLSIGPDGRRVYATRDGEVSVLFTPTKLEGSDNLNPGSRGITIDKPEYSDRPVVSVKEGESIQAAIDKAAEGSVIQVEPGVYRERLDITRDNIVLKGDGKAIIDLDGKNTSGAAINISGRKDVTIDGFEIRNVRGGDTPTGIRVDGASSDITLRNNNIHHVESDSNAHGIGVFGTSATALKNISIVGNQVHDLKLGQSESVVVNGNVDGFKIIGNKVYNNDNIGIDVIGFEGVGSAGVDQARNGIIAKNHVYNIGTTNNPTYGSASAAAIYVDGGRDLSIEDNLVESTDYGIELASEHQGKKTSGIKVRRNRVKNTRLAGISVGGGSSSNGGVSNSVIEDNDLRNNNRQIWKQHNVDSDVFFKNNDRIIEPDLNYEKKLQPIKVTRQFSDRSKFYKYQDDGVSCSAFSMAMMVSDHKLGRPVKSGSESHSFKKLAGTTSHGYRHSLEGMANQLRSKGLNARAYRYDKFGPQGLKELNKELDKGHTAVARVINDRTGNRHYIYIAGRDGDGNYIVGDPDRKNSKNHSVVSPERLLRDMSKRKPDGGFVAGWAKSETAATNVTGTAAYRRAEARERVEQSNPASGGAEKTVPESVHSKFDRAASQAGSAWRLAKTKEGVYLRSNFDVDVDGSPRARQIDRYGQTQTSWSHKNGKYINAEEVPYIVLPKGKYQKHGIKLGDYALVRDKQTGKVAAAVFADVGPAKKTGEGSIYLGKEKLGLDITPNKGVSGDRFEYLVFPGTSEGRARNQAELLERISRFEKKMGIGANGQVEKTSGEKERFRKNREVEEDAEKGAFSASNLGQVRLKGGMKPIVVLDSGHGGHDSGAVSGGVREKDVNLDLSNRIEKHLESMGIIVERTNPYGNFVGLHERADLSNRPMGKNHQRESNAYQADAFISIHANYGKKSARGFETFHYGSSRTGKALASAIQDSVIANDAEGEKLDTVNRKVKSAKFVVLRETVSPAALVEAGFLTNAIDRANLTDSQYKEKMARKIALGIGRFLKDREPRYR